MLSTVQQQRCRENKGFISKIRCFQCLQVRIGTCMLILGIKGKTKTKSKVICSALAREPFAEHWTLQVGSIQCRRQFLLSKIKSWYLRSSEDSQVSYKDKKKKTSSPRFLHGYREGSAVLLSSEGKKVKLSTFGSTTIKSKAILSVKLAQMLSSLLQKSAHQCTLQKSSSLASHYPAVARDTYTYAFHSQKQGKCFSMGHKGTRTSDLKLLND